MEENEEFNPDQFKIEFKEDELAKLSFFELDQLFNYVKIMVQRVRKKRFMISPTVEINFTQAYKLFQRIALYRQQRFKDFLIIDAKKNDES